MIAPGLRWRVLWLIVGWALIALLWYGSLTPAPPKMDFDHGDKWGHLLAYFVLTLWWMQLYRRRSQQHLLALGFAAMGLLLEVLQGLGGVRFFEFADLAANTLGVISAWVLAPTRLGQALQWFEARLTART